MIDERELLEIEDCARKGIAFPEGYRRMAAEIRRLRAALEDIVDRDKAPIDPNWPGLKPAGMRQVAMAALR